ncbi:hypothetical protein RB195_023329 [Necator americanus]|uniref:Uncharacterized protein n=1 Tax=Necator americanus TaxID=51031 RepID=A0ABR1EIP8_NECAM
MKLAGAARFDGPCDHKPLKHSAAAGFVSAAASRRTTLERSSLGAGFYCLLFALSENVKVGNLLLRLYTASLMLA